VTWFFSSFVTVADREIEDVGLIKKTPLSEELRSWVVWGYVNEKKANPCTVY